LGEPLAYILGKNISEFGGSLNDHEKSVPFLYMIIQEKNRSSFLKIGKKYNFLIRGAAIPPEGRGFLC